MKKRILVLLVAMFCLFSFASCKKDTPESLYTNAMTALEEAKGFEAKATIKIDSKVGSIENSTTVTMDMKSNGDNVSVEMEDYDIIYVDGVMYMDMGEELGKYKMELSAKDFAEDYGMSMDSSDFPKLDEEDFKDVELEKDGDNRTFTMTLDEKDIDEYVKDILDEQLGDSSDATVSNVTMTATFDKDDNLVKLNLKMDVAYESEGTDSISMKLDMTYEFTNPGVVPTVSAPADADDYDEMDASIFG